VGITGAAVTHGFRRRAWKTQKIPKIYKVCVCVCVCIICEGRQHEQHVVKTYC